MDDKFDTQTLFTVRKSALNLMPYQQWNLEREYPPGETITTSVHEFVKKIGFSRGMKSGICNAEEDLFFAALYGGWNGR